MKMKNQMIVSGMIASIAIMTAIGVYQVQAQSQTAEALVSITSVDKYFNKDFCATERTLLIDITYDSPTDHLQYEISDCPISNIVVHRWDELTIGEQNLIKTRMQTAGYIEN